MDAWVWIVIAVVVLGVVGLLAWNWTRERRTQQLRERFGPEYDRTMSQTGDRSAAEGELRTRQERREQLEIRPLAPESRDRYASRWTNVQAQFVDDPSAALADADRLLLEVMRERGYPMDDFDQRAADVSVDHPTVVEHYRHAHRISTQTERGETNTEEMRQGLVHYRALFEDLLERPQARRAS